MSHEDSAASEVREAEDGVPDLESSYGWRHPLLVLIIGHILVSTDLDNFDNVHDTGGDGADEKDVNYGLKSITAVREAARHPIEIGWEDLPWQRPVHFIGHDADVFSFDKEEEIAEHDGLDAHAHANEVGKDVTGFQRVAHHHGLCLRVDSLKIVIILVVITIIGWH